MVRTNDKLGIFYVICFISKNNWNISDMIEKKIANNAKWIIICKIAQSILQLVVGMLTARYLGPANYGLINYAKSVVAFVGPLTQLGLNATLVREFIDSPEREGEITGTALMMGVVSSMISIVLVSTFVSVANWGETQTIIVCFLYSISLIFQSIELIQYWFHYKLQSKYPSIMMLVSYVVVAIYKIYLLVTGKNIYWFAIVTSIEYGLIGISLLVIYHKNHAKKLSASFSMAKRLFARSKYYIFSAFMVTVFQNTDHIMLTVMSGDAENGIYTAAITCAGVCSFVYAAIIDSFRPVILAEKQAGQPSYEERISKLYCMIIYLALAQGIGFFCLAKPLISFLFGQEYMGAVPVLRVIVWYLAFSQMGRIRNIWILAEEKQYILWRINLIGALTNVALNAFMIPVWGAAGAACASLITQAATNFVLGFVMSSLKKNNELLLKGLNPRLLKSVLKETIHNIF